MTIHTHQNNVICSKSWTDVNIFLNNKLLKHCCKADFEPFETLNENFINNSPAVTERRTFSIEGVVHTQCQECLSTKGTYREIFNKPMVIPSNWDDAIEYIEIRFDNICDLSCLYCSPDDSNTIAKELKIEKHTILCDSRDLLTLLKFVEKLSIGKKLILNFLGGEPTASPNYYYFLSELAKTCSENELIIVTTTNGNMNSMTLDRILQLMQTSIAWKWIWGFSGESVNDVFENLRHGCSFSRWNANLNKLSKHEKTFAIGFNPSVNLLSLKTLPEYIEHITNMMSNDFYIFGNFILNPESLSICQADTSFKTYIESARNIFYQKKDLCKNIDEVERWFFALEQNLGTMHHDPQKVLDFLNHLNDIKNDTLNISLLMGQLE